MKVNSPITEIQAATIGAKYLKFKAVRKVSRYVKILAAWSTAGEFEFLGWVMSKHQDLSEFGAEVSNGPVDGQTAGKNSTKNRFENVVVKRERLFGLLQEEHLKERLAAKDTDCAKDAPSAGIFRLYGTGPLPDGTSKAAESGDPPSQEVVTIR